MPHAVNPYDRKHDTFSFQRLWQPVGETLPGMPPLESRGDKPLEMTFERELMSLVFYHVEEHTSGRHLLQVLDESKFARENIAPPDGVKKSTFFETINTRGLTQMAYVFHQLYAKANKVLPKAYAELGNLVAIDGSLIDGVLSMHWADYRRGCPKAKVHLGFDLNQGIPAKIILTSGKAGEGQFVSQLLDPGQTGSLDRAYQCHENFDLWQGEGKHFACRIKANTTKTPININEIKPGSIVFYDAVVILGSQKTNQTEKPVRVVGYQIGNVKYWVATDRFELTAEQIALIYKLRWEIEKFFAWWKRHLKVYHLIARSAYGLMVQILAGLITYLLLAIYCRENHGEKVSIKRVRELRIKIQNESRYFGDSVFNVFWLYMCQRHCLYAKT
jgi:hypothetical protein